MLKVCFLWYEVCEYFFGSKLLITTLKYFWGMSTENRVNLELDQHSRIGIKDVISMLKGLAANNLSHLTPHPLTVFLSYSHPPVTKRIEAIALLA